MAQTSALIGMVRRFAPPNRLASLAPSEHPVAEGEATAPPQVKGVLGVLAVRAGDHETVLVVGNRHHVVHLLHIRLLHLDLVQRSSVDAAIDMLFALVGAHRQHAFQRALHRLGIAGCQQVGQVFHGDAQRLDVGNLAVDAHLAGVGGGADRRQRRHVPDHGQRAVLGVQR
jgi:hypothetical protein